MGAWIVLILLFVVGLLLYFNMTVGDVVAAWLQRRDDRDELAAAEARQAARRSRTEPIPWHRSRPPPRSGSWNGSAPPSAGGTTTMSRR